MARGCRCHVGRVPYEYLNVANGTWARVQLRRLGYRINAVCEVRELPFLEARFFYDFYLLSFYTKMRFKQFIDIVLSIFYSNITLIVRHFSTKVSGQF